MEKFTVPQFIENEDKIISFLSVRQFIIILVSFGFIFVFYKLLSFIPFLLASILFGGAGMVVAFYKVNGQPFHLFLLHFVQTNQRPSLRIWKREVSKQEWEAEEQAIHDQQEREERERQSHLLPQKRELSARRLSELSLIVDTGGAYQGDTEDGKELF